MRNYKNESNWQKEKYCRVSAYIDKDVGEKLKAKLKQENKTIANWIYTNAIDYLKD